MQPTPLEQPVETRTIRRSLTIGLPAQHGGSDRCFALTPEGAAMLAERGYSLRIEQGASAIIHYDDEAWARAGAEVTDRRTAFGCDIVLHPAPLTPADAVMLRRGAVVFTMMHPTRQHPEALAIMLQRHITAIALDLIVDEHRRRPVYELMRSVAGRAAMAVASSLLADSVHGKGILLGGVAGVVPCEVMILGSDPAAVAAARSAVGQGAIVRMFDNNLYSLDEASERLGANVITSALHPRTYSKALATADIIVVTDPVSADAVVAQDRADMLKRGVIVFDLTDRPGEVFPWLKPIDLAVASASDCDRQLTARVCFINAAGAVPRTLAMGMTNTMIALFDRIMVSRGGFNNALRLNRGLCRACYTFMGKPVGEVTANLLGVRQVDINLFLQYS